MEIETKSKIKDAFRDFDPEEAIVSELTHEFEDMFKFPKRATPSIYKLRIPLQGKTPLLLQEAIDESLKLAEKLEWPNYMSGEYSIDDFDHLEISAIKEAVWGRLPKIEGLYYQEVHVSIQTHPIKSIDIGVSVN